MKMITLSGNFAMQIHEIIMTRDDYAALRQTMKKLTDTVVVMIDDEPPRARLVLQIINEKARQQVWPSSTNKAIDSAVRRLAAFVA